MGVGKCCPVYLFVPHVLDDAVPCGLVWLHIWLQVHTSSSRVSSLARGDVVWAASTPAWLEAGATRMAII